MSARTEYPHGVPCWVDIIEPDFDTSTAFYGQLFGWSFDVRTPEGAPVRYAYARLDGTVGGVGSAPEGQSATSGWTHYVAVDSVDDTVAAIEANGGKVIDPPGDVPGAGRSAVCADPEGAVWSNRAPPGSPPGHRIGLIQEAPNTFLILWDSGAREHNDYDDLGVRIVFEPQSARQRDRLGVMLAGVVGAAGFVRRRTSGA